MILTCPACTMRYLVSEGSVGPAGRRVRCASCGHQWFQEGETGLDATLFEEDEGDLSFVETQEPGHLETSETDFESILRKEMEHTPIPEGVRPVHDDSDIQAAVSKAPKKKISVPGGDRASGFIVAAAIWILAIVAFLLMQPQISRAWPPSNMIYNLVGMKPVMPGEGLALDALEAQLASGEILMRGTILNLRENDMRVPAIMVSIVDKDEKILDRVLIPPPVATLKGEGQAGFDAVYPKMPEGAANVKFAFSFLKAKPSEPSVKEKPTEKVEEHKEEPPKQRAPHH